MNERLKKYFKIGLTHFMTYPKSTDRELISTIKQICMDCFFDCIEIGRIEKKNMRTNILGIVEQSGVSLIYGTQSYMKEHLINLNSLNEEERRQSISIVKQCIDEAYEVNAVKLTFLSGRYQEEDKELCYEALVASVKELCAYAMCRGDLKLCMEQSDFDLDKCVLIGPSELAAKLAEEICVEFNNFGFLLDLSHIPQIHEEIEACVDKIAPYIEHVHIGNTVIIPGCEAYGDQHPRFGFPGDANGVDEAVRFIRKLMQVGYINDKKPCYLSLDVKPWGNEQSELVQANAKRYFDRVWSIV